MNYPILSNMTLISLLKEYECQFVKDETYIGTIPLTSMMIDTGTSDPISQKPYLIVMKHYQWVKEEIEKTTCSQGHLVVADPVGQH